MPKPGNLQTLGKGTLGVRVGVKVGVNLTVRDCQGFKGCPSHYQCSTVIGGLVRGRGWLGKGDVKDSKGARVSTNVQPLLTITYCRFG